MNRLVLLPLLSFSLLYACGSTHQRRDRNGSKADTTSSFRGKANVDPDTTLLSLKGSGAVSILEVLGQVWKFEDADKDHWNLVFWDSTENKRQFPELALFRDFCATENARCGIQLGKWKLDKETRELSLQFSNGRHKTYFIRKIAMKQMELVCGKDGDSILLQLTAPAIVHKQVQDDPFYPANNLWRIRPRASETDDQIRQRVKGFVHFFALFFLDNHARQEQDISFSGLPCSLVWYNGGIGMQSRLEVDKRWIACFWSEKEAMKGYDMLAELLGRHELKWPEHPTSWIQQIGQVLDQMTDKL